MMFSSICAQLEDTEQGCPFCLSLLGHYVSVRLSGSLFSDFRVSICIARCCWSGHQESNRPRDSDYVQTDELAGQMRLLTTGMLHLCRHPVLFWLASRELARTPERTPELFMAHVLYWSAVLVLT